jgi:hypothetical protein
MKILSFLTFIALLFGCSPEKRYMQQSPEIEVVKSNIGYYVDGDWDAYEANYAEGAIIFFNTTEDSPASIQETIAGQKLTIEPLSSYSFDREKDSFEMVVTDDGETWVNFWGLWKGTIEASGESFEMPVHLTSKFVDGKIVEMLGYWNNTGITMALTKLSEAQVAMETKDIDQ